MNNNRHFFKKQKRTKMTKKRTTKITNTLPTIKMKTKNTIL